MGADNSSVEKSLDNRAIMIADIIGFGIDAPGKKKVVDKLLWMIDQQRDEDEDGMSFALEEYHEVPSINASIRLRLIPEVEIKKDKTGQQKQEFVLKVTTGDIITSKQEEQELFKVASQLQEALSVKCVPVSRKIRN